MFDEHPGFLERALIGQKLDSFPRGELSAPVLGVDPLCSAAAKGSRAARKAPPGVAGRGVAAGPA